MEEIKCEKLTDPTCRDRCKNREERTNKREGDNKGQEKAIDSSLKRVNLTNSK